VSFREKRAVVTYDPDRVTPEGLVEAVGETGFSASLPAATDG
jgi:copper chaperone CopZ